MIRRLPTAPPARASLASKAVADILRSFRNQRPVRGGSLIITIFGDAIAPRGGVATLGSLIQLAHPFGLTERLVRTAVGRLAQDGWLVARRDGRRSEYRLTPGGQERFAEATARIYGRAPDTWDKQWTLLILPAAARKAVTGARATTSGKSRTVRKSAAAGKRPDDVRDELRWLGFGQVSPGVFAHADGRLENIRSRLRERNLADALLFRSSSQDLEADRQLVARGWDLEGLGRRYRRFVEHFKPLQAGGSATLAPQAAFVVRTLLIHEYRKIHLQDPLLPPALLPAGWIGGIAYEVCAELYGSVFARAEEFLSSTAHTLTETLPPPDKHTYTRFGGIKSGAGSADLPVVDHALGLAD